MGESTESNFEKCTEKAKKDLETGKKLKKILEEASCSILLGWDRNADEKYAILSTIDLPDPYNRGLRIDPAFKKGGSIELRLHETEDSGPVIYFESEFPFKFDGGVKKSQKIVRGIFQYIRFNQVGSVRIEPDIERFSPEQKKKYHDSIRNNGYYQQVFYIRTEKQRTDFGRE